MCEIRIQGAWANRRRRRERRAVMGWVISLLNGYLESGNVFNQDIFWMVLRGRQGRKDDGDEMQEACCARVGLALCIWVKDCIWLT